MTDRFELEQQLLIFNQIITDIQELEGTENNDRLMNVLAYYEHRFEQLWSAFEQMVRDDHKKNHGSITLRQMQDVTRLEVIDELGRSYTKCNILNKTFSFQDDGRTLKIFLDPKGTATNENLSE